MSDKTLIKEKYDSTAGIYNERYGDIQEEKYHCMLQDISIKKPVLDLGCGTGMLKEFLKVPMIGIDISFEMLKKSKEKNIQSDMENLPFKDNSFATILSFTALQNLDSADAALLEVKRILKPKGTFVLTVLNKFAGKLDVVEKYFKIMEMKICGEDVGLILSADK